MRVEYINPFVESAYNVLKEVMAGTEVKRGVLGLKATSTPIKGVAALVGLAGDVEGRVLFDMSKETALFVVSTMNQEVFEKMDEMAKATIQELANMITAHAITKLHRLGFKFDITPPAVFTGENMEISSNSNEKLEALYVPMELENGHLIDVNVVIRERMNK
ncbi:MAG: chemotaxis protein CheX [Spirochaetes bacterium]|nr:chemotaxis protein CheX [Spirochaetota bacterium]